MARTKRRAVLALFLLLPLIDAPRVAWAQQPAAPAAAEASGVTLRGRVVDAYPGAMPRPDVVSFARLDGPPVQVTDRVPIAPDRTFVFEHVAPGRYELRAGRSFSTTEVMVATADVRDIELVVSGETAFEVRARMDDGSAVPAEGYARVFINVTRSMSAALDTPSALTLPPGDHWVFFIAPPGVHVRSASTADADLLRAPLAVAPGDSHRVIDVVLTRAKPADAPMVTVAGVAGRSGLELELVDTTNSRRIEFVGTTTTDADGRFRFAPVHRGIFRIGAPPADRVVENLQVGAGQIEVTIPIAADARVVAGGLVTIDVSGKRVVLLRQARMALVAEREGTVTRIPVTFTGYWGALVPGAYRMTVEGLEPGFSIRSFTAGSTNLLEQPFVVPRDRPAETIELALAYTAPN